MSKVAVIFGATGQDGSYLSELLVEHDYRVIGVERRSSVNTHERVQGLMSHSSFVLVEGDVTDATGVSDIIATTRPDEVYNLAAQSHVGTSFKTPSYTFETNAVGVLNILEAIRQRSPSSKFYQASTSELFGDTKECPQNEQTRFNPNSPYAVAKLAAHHLVGLYRRAYDIFACAGILFNHESPKRGNNFVTRKITQYVAHLAMAYEKDRPTFPKLPLGNLDAKRDWGHARDYVRAMWMMMQQSSPDDFVIATGETHSVKEFCELAFSVIDADYRDWIFVDSKCMRPADVNLLCGNAGKAHSVLGWYPKYNFHQLVQEMVASDIGALNCQG